MSAVAVRRVRGFSLIELLAAVAIVTILAAIAYPGYQRQTANSRRVLAAACLLQHAQALERHYAARQSWLDAPEPAPCREVAGVYQISFAAPPGASAYVLQAIPHGAQAVLDARCGTLTLNQRGERGSSGDGADAEPMQCW